MSVLQTRIVIHLKLIYDFATPLQGVRLESDFENTKWIPSQDFTVWQEEQMMWSQLALKFE